MPSLPVEIWEELSEPITTEELGVALAHFKSKKAPVPDVHTLAYYKAFCAILSPHLVPALNSLTERKPMPLDNLLGYFFALIPKERKDLSQCGSYPPLLPS